MAADDGSAPVVTFLGVSKLERCEVIFDCGSPELQREIRSELRRLGVSSRTFGPKSLGSKVVVCMWARSEALAVRTLEYMIAMLRANYPNYSPDKYRLSELWVKFGSTWTEEDLMVELAKWVEWSRDEIAARGSEGEKS